MPYIIGSTVTASVPGIKWDSPRHSFAGRVLSIVGNIMAVSCDGGPNCTNPPGVHAHDVRPSTARPVLS